MKLKNLFGILLLFFCSVCLISCDSEEAEPLSLHGVDNYTIHLTYGTKGGVTIIGGDRKYSFTCETPIVKGEMTHSNYILFEPLAVGQTTCLIQDQSGSTYALTIHIDYASTAMRVDKTDAVVSGKNLSEKQKNALKEKALATIPVEANGGYLFVHTEKIDLTSSEPNLNKSKGIVYIYPKTFGENPINATFERIAFRDDKDMFLLYEYKLQSEDESWHYTLKVVPASKTSVIDKTVDKYVLEEDLKAKFASDYAEADTVKTYQYIGYF